MAIDVDVGAVLWAGRDLLIEQAVPVPDFASRVFSEPAQLCLEIHRLGRGLAITGTINVVYSGICDRCLGEVAHAMRIDVEEHFTPESTQSRGKADPFAQSNVLNGTMLDISDLARQLIGSALPLTILCSEECRGLEAYLTALETTWPT